VNGKLKYKVVEVKKRRFSDNRLIGWLFIDKYQVIVEFEDKRRKKIKIFVSELEEGSLRVLMYQLHSELMTGDQFKEDFTEWLDKHAKIIDTQLPLFRKGHARDIIGLIDFL
jgi:hypothetical protein